MSQWSDLNRQIAADPRHPCSRTLQRLMDVTAERDSLREALTMLVKDVNAAINEGAYPETEHMAHLLGQCGCFFAGTNSHEPTRRHRSVHGRMARLVVARRDPAGLAMTLDEAIRQLDARAVATAQGHVPVWTNDDVKAVRTVLHVLHRRLRTVAVRAQ